MPARPLGPCFIARAAQGPEGTPLPKRSRGRSAKVKERIRSLSWKGAAAASLVLLLAFAVPAGSRLLAFKDRYVMVTVEESSTGAVVSWPLLMERLPGVFVDCSSSSLALPEKPGLMGVCLALYYSAVSQGIEFEDSVTFSRTGRAKLSLDRPVSLMTEGQDGSPVEMVDNRARVIAGPLLVERTSVDGAVCLRYGETRFSLKPGESWAEMLALTPEGVRAIRASDWDVEFHHCIDKGYPVTRLAIANRGLWPKAAVKAGTSP